MFLLHGVLVVPVLSYILKALTACVSLFLISGMAASSSVESRPAGLWVPPPPSTPFTHTFHLQLRASCNLRVISKKKRQQLLLPKLSHTPFENTQQDSNGSSSCSSNVVNPSLFFVLANLLFGNANISELNKDALLVLFVDLLQPDFSRASQRHTLQDSHDEKVSSVFLPSFLGLSQ